MIKALRFLLFPLSALYGTLTRVRNRLYDQGLKPSSRFELPVILVGNLAVGGTGKTPMIEHLIRLLQRHYTLGTLSRGYGRATHGFRIASEVDSAATVGDEPYQFYRKFRGKVVIAVGEERALAIPYMVDLHPEIEVILMDDGYQHRKVRPSFQILLTNYHNLFYKDFLLPAGNLRESRAGAGRADVVVVTKCPGEIGEERMMDIEGKIRQYTPKPVFFTTLHYDELSPINDKIAGENVILVSGIANSKPLETYVKANYTLLKHFVFNDHHVYSSREVQSFCQFAKTTQATILTTEKDAAKLDSPQFKPFFSDIPFFYLPVEIQFLKNGKDFDELVLNACKGGSS